MRYLILLLVASCVVPTPETESCTVNDLGDGEYELSCPDGTSVTIENGTDGTNATAAPPSGIALSIACAGTLAYTDIDVRYHVAYTASGDVYVSGAILFATAQYSATEFYMASQGGSQDAGVIIVADAYGESNFGYWRLKMQRTGDSVVVVVEYRDSEITSGGDIWTQPSSDCIVVAP